MPIKREYKGHEYAIVANAEFFNHKELRGKLEGKYTFATHSDVEVALYAYIEWGDACVEHLHGQFAFLVYDGSKNRVFLARDRVGIKPLYYGLLAHTLIVSSEPKGILAHPDFRREPDREAIADYFLGILALGKSEPLDRSFFEGIRSLPPGSRAYFDHTGLSVERYHDVSLVRRERPEKELAAEMRREVSRAVLEQIPEEVAYGVGLSGGLDSSIVTVVAARSPTRPSAASAIRCEGGDNPDYEYAKLVAQRERIPLLAPVLSSKDLIRDVDRLVAALDRPFDSVRELGLFGMYRTLHDAGCKVALIGEGSDEFNLGYYYALPGFNEAREACATADGLRSLLKTRVPDVVRYFSPQFLNERVVEEAIDRNVRDYYEGCPAGDSLDRMEYYYIKKFLKGRLDMHDRCAMAHAVEARVPFCDDGVIEPSLSVPPRFNLKDETEKAVLRSAFRDMLPEEVVNRRKYGLPESKDTKLHRLVIEAFDAAVAEADAAVWDIIDKTYADTMRKLADERVTEAENGTASPHSLTAPPAISKPLEFRIRHLFVLLTFLRWYRLYFVEKLFS